MTIPPWVSDYSMARPGVGQLQNAGAVGAIRYICPGRYDGVAITQDEVNEFHATGFAYGLVTEYGADWVLEGYQQGYNIAIAARNQARQMGIPDGVLYAACDFEIAPYQYGAALSTMQGMADALGGWQYVGTYGSRWWCQWVGANSGCTHFWSTDAWSDYVPSTNSDLHQHAGWPAGVPYVDGCDHNVIYGDWAPRTIPIVEDDLTPDQDAKLSALVKASYQTGVAVSGLENELKIVRTELEAMKAAQRPGVEEMMQAIKGITVPGADLAPVLEKLNGLVLRVA